MKVLGYFDDVLTSLFTWQFGSLYIAIPMCLIEIIIFLYLYQTFRKKMPL